MHVHYSVQRLKLETELRQGVRKKGMQRKKGGGGQGRKKERRGGGEGGKEKGGGRKEEEYRTNYFHSYFLS